MYITSKDRTNNTNKHLWHKGKIICKSSAPEIPFDVRQLLRSTTFVKDHKRSTHISNNQQISEEANKDQQKNK